MSTFITFIEFSAADGSLILQRADQISTIMEGTVPAKGSGKPPRPVLHLLLANNNRVQVLNETRESIMNKLLAANGTLPIVIVRQPDSEVAEEASEAA